VDAVNGAVSVSQGKVMVRLGSTTTSGAPPGVRLDAGQMSSTGAGSMITVEQLGEKAVNGVMAQGTRNLRTIPAGAIGNDRDLQMVDERWFSNDLQVMIKSINSDPRFGETTYQLTNIVRAPQDPSLFQVPNDYVEKNLQ
jgi:hypothetical protein